MSEIVVVGSFTVKAALARSDELFSEGDIVIYEALPGGETRKGSIAAHAGDA
jgi:hypothetical protein